MTKSPSHTGHDGGHPSRLLTIPEVAELLRTNDATLRYWRSTGKGPVSFRVGRHVRYWDTQVAEWLAQQQDDDGPTQRW